MPKKVKKAKGSGKSKKGKSENGKKDGVPRDDILKDAIANAQLWESRLGATESAKNDYRESTRTLLYENEKLQTQVAQTEKDTIEVISFLKDEDIKKDSQIIKLQNMVKDLKKEFRKDKQNLIKEYTTEIESLQTTLAERTNEVKLMQSELKLVKEFRRKRAQMQKELDEIRDNVSRTDKQHKESLEKMERKFFEEKIRLQQEASRKISELAERAHTEAISNLDETTKSIYMENVRLNEALNYHVKSAEDLSQTKEKLLKENKQLSEEKEMNSLIVEEKVVQTKQLQKQVKELRDKVSNLEHTLTQVIKENEAEKNELRHAHERSQEHNKMEIARLQKTIELKSKEASRVKKLAKSILDQRSEMEHFFLDSLELVKSEINRNRTQYRREAEAAYHQRMLAAHSGQADYPRIRTFKSSKFSTNSVFSDLKEAEKWDGLDTTVDISELTWEQREKVLRLLFAKMNGYNGGSVTKTNELPPIKNTEHSRLSITDSGASFKPRPPSVKAFLTEAEEEAATLHGACRILSATEVLGNG